MKNLAYLVFSWVSFAILACPVTCGALTSDQILVIANRNARHSIALAQYYMEKRHINKKRLVKAWVTDKETCSRKDYNEKVLNPLLKYLKKDDPYGQIKCIVTMYGLPLKVSPPKMSKEEAQEYRALKKEREILYKKLKSLGKTKENRTNRKELEKRLKKLKRQMNSLARTNERSALDSELTLALNGQYPLAGWIPNPYFFGFRKRQIKNMPDEVLMVSRLDGPNPETVKRMIDDSIEAEKRGLKGVAYFDARWPVPDKQKANKIKGGYGFYDYSIHLAAMRVKKSGHMPVIIDDKPTLFQPGQCPNAALYCGWYSLAHYVDAFTWNPGSIGYHIASQECQTLHGKGNFWCKRMLEKGVAATVGPVSEPYIQAFPIPEAFFGALITGRFTLAECYFLSVPFLSWQMVLIGDPLYRPFGLKN